MIGEIDNTAVVSTFQPSQEVLDFTKLVRDDYSTGVDILNKPWLELNDRSIVDDENHGQQMFNAFVDTSEEDPNEAWKWRGTRSMARNKGIAMHANLTAAYILPLFMAQNDEDEMDRDFSEVMRDIIEWMAEPINSNYQSSFLQVVFGMITNPVTFMSAEYCEVMQTIKEKKGDGYTTKEIVDTVLSGFKAPIYSSSQILITNAYERNIQRQRAIIKRRWVEKSELEAKYGEHENWGYVKSGIRTVYSEDEGRFYDIKDDEHLTVVAEETYLNRRDDTEVCFINGIYMGEANVDDNPIKHRDHKGAPKYNVVPYGYYRIGEHFFYYKSMMNALGWDNALYDAMSEIIMNNAILEQDPPVAVSGTDKIESDINFPGAVVAFEDKDTKVMPLFPAKNFVAGFQALEETKNSISDGSVNETASGQLPEASQKAYSVSQAMAASKKMLSDVAKSLAESTVMFGDLMKDIALNHITVPEVGELTGAKMKLKYRTFILSNKKSGGKMVDKHIKFDESLIGLELSEEEQKYRSLALLEKTGYPDNKQSLYLVNPELFAKFNYLCKVDIEEMFPKNEEYWQAILTNLFQILANDPYIEGELLRRKLLYAYFQSDGEDLIKKQPIAPQMQPGMMQQPTQPGQPAGGQPASLGPMAQQKALSTVTGGVMGA